MDERGADDARAGGADDPLAKADPRARALADTRVLDGTLAPDAAAEAAIAMGLEEFFISPSFEPAWVAALIRAGFLPMAYGAPWGEVLLPKLHEVRSVLRFPDLRITKSARAASARYLLRVDGDFRLTMEHCARVHGEDWLRPALRDCFERLHEAARIGPDAAALRTGAGAPGRLRFLSFELLRESDQALVAGEIGYCQGGVYTSLSGFRLEDSAGTVQMLAAGALLARGGAAFWDLGMPLPYKASLGAADVDRRSFHRAYRLARDLPPPDLGGPGETFAARALLDEHRRHFPARRGPC